MDESEPIVTIPRYTPMPSRLLGNKYEAVTPIGRGGMASVWQGYTHGEAGFRRKVGIKRVLRHLHEDEKFAAMFVEEARVVAELNHPNIVQVHDFGRDPEGGYFIIMEWVEGMNLADYVTAYAKAGEKPPWPHVAAICIEVLRALSAAHARTEDSGRPVPVIHRDVTPSNILVGTNGVVKLTDFGLARATDRPRTTDPGIVKGKVAYLAPELFHDAKPEPRCDLYSLGVVMWEALAARRMFDSALTDVQIALAILEGKIPPVTDLRPELPEELVAIVAQATAKQARDRFARATEMIDALSGLLRKHPEPTDAPALARSVRAANGYIMRATKDG
ncbi:MAG TPA: serine/threonine-protein kinase [Polyangiales bacterium]